MMYSWTFGTCVSGTDDFLSHFSPDDDQTLYPSKDPLLPSACSLSPHFSTDEDDDEVL